ncbi:hypothetical protein ANN_25036 [Periplaneta americana]|uniref:Uncharacterized protein n=1 Tax=Periplaneta americana TaxID=6978 RepID=A0ABQ8S0K5_PERAM|nr:hypothetical protein ANN_25036 [Periplaneta americana]
MSSQCVVSLVEAKNHVAAIATRTKPFCMFLVSAEKGNCCGTIVITELEAELLNVSKRLESLTFMKKCIVFHPLAPQNGILRRFINSLGYLASEWDEGDNAGEMSPGSSTENYPAFAHIGLRENPGKNLNQVTCLDRESNPGHLVSRPDALTVTPQVWTFKLLSVSFR